MGEFLESVACSGADCFSWMLVLFNILAVFYLVFCSFWKVTRVAKITGWVWIAGLLCATVGILIAHTCIYTLLVTIFTAMMIMAILAVILPQQSTAECEERAEKPIKLGSYVISGTDDDRYVFAIHDAQRRLIVKSRYSYATIDEAKREICVCRDNGMMAAISDKTGAWIKEEYYPTFEIYARDGKYYFCLSINGEYVIFNSESYGDIKTCERMLERAKTLVASTAVYINTVKVSGKGCEHFGEPVAEAPAEAEPVVEETAAPVVEVAEETPAEEAIEEPADKVVEAPADETVEEPADEAVEAPAEETVEAPTEEVVEAPAEEVAEAPVEAAEAVVSDDAVTVTETVIEDVFVDEAEEVSVVRSDSDAEGAPDANEASGVEVIGVVWPESHREDKIYRYDPNGETLEVGDIVLVPSRDEAQDRDIVRASAVVQPNYRIDSDLLRRPLKKIIKVISRKMDIMLPAEELDAEDGAEDEISGNVVFNAKSKTLWDRYADLSEEQKGFFDKISEYAGGKENVKSIEAKNYLTFKYMRDKLVRLRIRRDMVEAVFMLVGSDFKNAFSEGDVKVRDAATIIRVEGEAHLDVVLTTIDMAYAALLEERARRKEEQKARRRKARRAAAEYDADVAEAIAATEVEATEEADDAKKELITV